jgi:signal transduction histidine kinase
VRGLIRQGGLGSVLHAPIGAGSECLGSFILTRDPGAPDWSAAELAQAAEVGRDLGRMIRNGQTLTRAQELVRDLFELDAYKSHLIAMISHELKNPLTVLTAHRDLLEPELTGPADRAALAAIDAGTRRMSRVVDNLLVLARLADPDTPHVDRELDLHDLLDDVRSELAAAASRRGVALRLAAPAGPLLLRGDQAQLRTMLANLVENGLKFSDDGGAVEVTVARRGTGVEISVTDGGIGISEADRGRLFTDFFRADDPAARARPGSGLGLTIVDRILRRHGGRVEVDSRPGEGSTFRVWLPAL